MKKYIIISIIIASISLIGVRVYQKVQDSKPVEAEVKPISVEGEPVRKGAISDYAVFTGKIEAIQTVSIIPTVPAIVESLNVKEGDMVKKGQLLFQLDADNAQNQAIQADVGVRQAQIGVKNAEAAAKQAAASYDMAKAKYDMDYQNYLFARENLVKYEELYKEGVISENEFKQIKLNSSESTLELLKKQLEQAELAKKQAAAGIENANAAVTMARSGYNMAADSLNDTTFTAPIEGFVSSISISEKEMAGSMQPAMIVHDINSVQINVNVSETFVNRIKKGDKVEVELTSLKGKMAEGVIKTVSPAADERTMLYKVTIEVNNKSHEIKPGMFANVKIKTDKKSNSIYVKGSAVFSEEGKNYVFIQKGESNVEKKPVETGIDNGEYTEIKSGLSEKDIYIYKGVGFLKEDSVIAMVRGDK